MAKRRGRATSLDGLVARLSELDSERQAITNRLRTAIVSLGLPSPLFLPVSSESGSSLRPCRLLFFRLATAGPSAVSSLCRKGHRHSNKERFKTNSIQFYRPTRPSISISPWRDEVAKQRASSPFCF